MQFPSTIVALARTMDTRVILDPSTGCFRVMKKTSEVRRRRKFDKAESSQSEASVICGLAGKKSWRILARDSQFFTLLLVARPHVR